jgi:hypothetical protein
MAPNTALDLARNERLYRDVPYQSRAPGDRAAILAPLADARSAKGLPASDEGFPIQYGSDEVWERPVCEMVDEVWNRQVAQSGLFAAVGVAGAEALVVVPTLQSFTTGAIERIAGAQSFAEVALRLQVYGPQDASGQRGLLLDRVYADRKITEPGLRPVSPYLLVGGALRTAVQKALAGLDGSNVGRSSVPMEAVLSGALAPDR